jgi:hypothetical protein
LEEGEIVVTLFSKVYPLVRFGTGDLASYTDQPCSCGRTAPRITKILGMIGEHIRVKGMFVHMKELDEAFSKLPEVLKYQMVLKLDGHKDQITLNAETEPGVDRKSLSQAINQRCQEVFKLRMDAIEFLPKGKLPQEYIGFDTMAGRYEADFMIPKLLWITSRNDGQGWMRKKELGLREYTWKEVRNIKNFSLGLMSLGSSEGCHGHPGR